MIETFEFVPSAGAGTAREIATGDPSLRAALEDEGLPVDDLEEAGRHFFAFHGAGGEIVGFAGIETAGDSALLRSLVVSRHLRGQGYGRRITNWLLRRMAGGGVRRTYFLTLSPAAVGMGERCGFRRISRDEAPPAIQASRQFTALCPASAILMYHEGKSMDKVEIKESVRKNYAAVATRADSPASCGCGCGSGTNAREKSRRMGYSDEELAAVPDGANLGLGCGNPQGLAALRPGDVVVDLGSGAGFDCFLAARQVGDTGRVIGVDMTHEMLKKARENAIKVAVSNVEFRLGEIEHLPIADGVADVVISNCVVNLSTDKPQVFREAFRVLKAGGRIAISDVVSLKPMPERMTSDPKLYCSCVAGAASPAENDRWLKEAGFIDVAVTPKSESREIVKEWSPGSHIEEYVISAMIEARKP